MFFPSADGSQAVELVPEWVTGGATAPRLQPLRGGVLLRMCIRLGERDQIYDATMEISWPAWERFLRELYDLLGGRSPSTLLFSLCQRYGFWIEAGAASEEFTLDVRFEGVQTKVVVNRERMLFAAREFVRTALAFEEVGKSDPTVVLWWQGQSFLDAFRSYLDDALGES